METETQQETVENDIPQKYQSCIRDKPTGGNVAEGGRRRVRLMTSVFDLASLQLNSIRSTFDPFQTDLWDNNFHPSIISSPPPTSPRGTAEYNYI